MSPPSPPRPMPPGRGRTSTACTPRHTAPSTSSGSAPTSTPPARTSGPAHMWARSSPIQSCSRCCRPTSWHRRATRCRAALSGHEPLADLAGVAAAVDHLSASLDPDARGLSSRAGARLDVRLRATRAAAVPVAARRAQPAEGRDHIWRRKKPHRHRLLQRVRPRAPGCGRHLAGRHVNVWNGDITPTSSLERSAFPSPGSAVPAGFVHYNDQSEVDRLLAGLEELSS